MSQLRRIIDTINGNLLSVGDGVSVGLTRPDFLTPVVSMVGDTLRIGFPQWLPVLIELGPLSKVAFPILAAIEKNQPVEVGGYWVDFHGQLPKITPHSTQACLELTWRTDPRIDVKFLPGRFDPVIRSVTLFSNGAQINGHGWKKWVEL